MRRGRSKAYEYESPRELQELRREELHQDFEGDNGGETMQRVRE